MDVYPLLFHPMYKEKIWGGRNLQRLFGRELPDTSPIGESWDLADLPEGVSIVRNGPLNGRTLTDVTGDMGTDLLGAARPMDDGRFPLLLKLLDANDTLSLQVHPDAKAVTEIPGAALKTECWYVLESRDGYIYKGLQRGVQAEAFREAITNDTVEKYVRRVDCSDGDFHFLPAGTVHALGSGLVVAEVQTPSDTTYRVTDWGRGREIHVDRAMQCIHFEQASDDAPGAGGDVLLETEFFHVALRHADAGEPADLPRGICTALMLLEGSDMEIVHAGKAEPRVALAAGDTVLLPAALREAVLRSGSPARWLEVTLPGN